MPATDEARAGRSGCWTDVAMRAASVLVPACLAAAHAGDVPDAAHDTGVARVLGLEPQPWRAVDVAVGALLQALPVGTRAERAALGGALIVGAAGGVLHSLIRRLLRASADAPRLGPLVAAIATLSAVAAPPWLLESAVAGGTTTGALLVVLAIALTLRARDGGDGASWGAAAGALGLALGQEPFTGAQAIAGCAALLVIDARSRSEAVAAWARHKRAIGAGGLVGLLPWLVAFARTRASGTPVLAALANGWAGERGAATETARAFLRGEMGWTFLGLTAGGAVLAALLPRARSVAAAMGAVAVIGIGAGWAGAPLGPTRFGAPVLAGLAGAAALAGVAMQAIVRAVAVAKLPYVRASAAMIAVLEIVLPVDSADEAIVRMQPRAHGEAVAAWDDLAWSGLPPRSVVLVTDPRIDARARAARATGALRGDLTVVPAYARGASARRALASDPALIPLWRDLEFAGAPSEAALSSLATVRPLAMAYDPRWGVALGRHLVPVDLFDRFELEPRGASDRRHVLDAFTARRDRLARLTAHEPELESAAAYLLRARALALAGNGDRDRDLIALALADVRAFAPDDAVAATIAARAAASRGAVHVQDLKP